MGDSTPVTITVDRADLDRVLDCAHRCGGPNVDAATTRIRAAIPAPAWEPSEAMVMAYCSIDGDATENDRYDARKALATLHSAGFDLTLREATDG